MAARGVGWAVDECSSFSDFYLEELAFSVQFGAKVGCLPRVGVRRCLVVDKRHRSYPNRGLRMRHIDVVAVIRTYDLVVRLRGVVTIPPDRFDAIHGVEQSASEPARAPGHQFDVGGKPGR